jgi:NAD(P)-dependent dehydrogenase (short-subunit alcohol dehydrogenase family)
VALTTTASTVRGRLDDKVVLITGTGRGQGRAAAQLFCTEGARVVGCDLDAPANAETVSTITASGGHIVGMAPVDLGDSAQARQWVHDAAAVHGRIDVLFNNAAAPRFAAIDDLTDDDWHSTIRNELDLIFYVTQAAWQYVSASSGTIVNTASVQAHIGIPPNGGLAHAAAKGGVVAMTRQLAAEGAPLGIRANSISPGTVGTPANAHIFDSDETRQEVLAPLLIKRLGQARDIATLALYLASDESSYVSGADFIIDGGLTAT